MQPTARRGHAPRSPFDRISGLRAVLLLAGVLFVGRLFYLQIIQHEHYQQKAIAEHLSKFEIPAERGGLEVYDGARTVPIVLNEIKYTLFADPELVDKAEESALKLADVLKQDAAGIKEKLTVDSRYSIIAKKLSREQYDAVIKLDLAGIGVKAQSYRTYPQGQLASQLLGFVNDDGVGQYGVEGYLNETLSGKSGTLKAITDNSERRVPLATVNENILVRPEPGKTAVLSIDINLQRLVEDALKAGVETVKAKSGSAIVMEANTGAVVAMANMPTYDPTHYVDITDQAVFSNAVVNAPLEVGSIMKTLTVATALNEGVIGYEGTYLDPGRTEVDGKVIRNAIEYGSGQRTVSEILVKSLNTGVVELLRKLGGGQINEKARQTIYDYNTQRYQFGKLTGIEQDGEVAGVVQSPVEGDGLNIRYANMVFGQGITATLLQMAGAMSAAVNGGIYYQPHVVVGYKEGGKLQLSEPHVLRRDVVSSATSEQLRILMERVVQSNNRAAVRAGYGIGGKTGTAQIPDGQGGYREDAYIGTYIGFVGGAKPEHVIVVRIDEPGVPGFAGTVGAAPVFAQISKGVVDIFALPPKP
jgi:stage V sporulation protein D (sporulation-specific penicillin-binding protein)